MQQILKALIGLSVGFSSIAFAQVQPITEVFSPPVPANPSNYMKVAVVQYNPHQDAPLDVPKEQKLQYLQHNREDMAARAQTAIAQGAQYISFSEFAVVGYPDIPDLPSEEDDFRNRDDIKDFTDTIPGVSTAFFSKIAADNHVWIQFGMAEVDPKTDKYYNAIVVINDKGQVAATYHKQSLYQLENNFLSAGNTPTTFDSPMGKIGLVACSDIYNSTVLNQYKTAKVDILSLSTSWAHWNSGMSTFESAAKQLGVYVLAANQTYFPDSGVINPDGSDQSHIRQSGDSIAYGYVPLKKASKK